MVNSIYTVIIRGGTNPPNLISGESTDGVYRVDWLSVLPNFENPHHHRWRLTASFRTEIGDSYSTADDTFVFVECPSFGKAGFYDTLRYSTSPVICVAHLNTTFYNNAETNVFSYHKTENVMPVTVHFPTENTLSIKLTGINGEILDDTKYTGWVLTLQLEKVSH